MRARVGLALMVAVAISAVSGTTAAPAAAALTCGPETLEQPFLPWFDPFQYVLAEGGALESADGWTLAGGARLVAENEPFYVHSSSDNSSLYLPAGSSATSPWTCIGLERPTLRFFAVTTGPPLALLNVEMVYKTRSGGVRALPVLPPPTALTHRSWAPTLLPLPLATDLVLRDLLVLDLNATHVAFRFTPSNGLLTRGSWKIDDLYVDPWVTNW